MQIRKRPSDQTPKGRDRAPSTPSSKTALDRLNLTHSALAVFSAERRASESESLAST